MNCGKPYRVRTPVLVPVMYKGMAMGDDLADIVVASKVILEIKAVAAIAGT